MKTKNISSNNNSHYYFIIAVIVAFSCTGCPQYEYESQPPDEQSINADIITEYVYVQPTGTSVTAFDGSVMLDFPAGAIATPTRFSLVSFPLEHLDLDGINVMQRGFSIKNITNDNKFAYPVKIILRYDLVNFNECQPNDESDLSICRFYGDRYAFHKIESIGDCFMNCSCKTISTCIDECGTYVVGEN